MKIESMLRDLGRARRQETRRIQRRAQLRENLRRTVYTAIWVFATVAICVWLLSM